MGLVYILLKEINYGVIESTETFNKSASSMRQKFDSERCVVLYHKNVNNLSE